MKDYTTSEVAIILGMQPETITRYVKRGVIEGVKRGRDYFVTQQTLEAYQQKRRRAERARKMHAEGISAQEICKVLKIAEGTLYRYLKG